MLVLSFGLATVSATNRSCYLASRPWKDCRCDRVDHVSFLIASFSFVPRTIGKLMDPLGLNHGPPAAARRRLVTLSLSTTLLFLHTPLPGLEPTLHINLRLKLGQANHERYANAGRRVWALCHVWLAIEAGQAEMEENRSQRPLIDSRPNDEDAVGTRCDKARRRRGGWRQHSRGRACLGSRSRSHCPASVKGVASRWDGVQLSHTPPFSSSIHSDCVCGYSVLHPLRSPVDFSSTSGPSSPAQPLLQGKPQHSIPCGCG
jgi:hypothetical protein